MIQSMLIKLGAIAGAVIACIAIGWFAGAAHYSKALSSLEGQLQAGADAQRRAVAEQIAKDGLAAKAVDDEAKSQIGSMSAVIADLSVRNAHPSSTGRLCATPASAPVARTKPDRPAAAGSPVAPSGPAAASPGPAAVSAAGVDLGALSDALELGAESIKAELLWRQYARQTGQVKASP